MIIKIKNTCNWLFNSTLIKNAFKIALGNIISQILAVVFTPIITRIYGPDLYGELGIFTSTWQMINGIVCLGLVSAIISPKDDKEASGIYKICTICTIGIGIIFFIIVMIISPFYKVISISPDYYITCILLLICLIINSFTALNYTWGNREKAYKLLLWNPIIGSVVNFIIVIIFGYLDLKQYGLILGVIISQIVIFFHLYLRFRPLKYENSYSELKSILKKYSDFPKYQMTSNLVKGLSVNIPILIMSAFFGTSFIGQYNMGQRLLYMPITLIASALGQVHFKEATDIVNTGGDAGEITYRIIRIILLVCFLPLLVLGVFGDKIFEIFLGAEWNLSGQIVKIRSLEFMFTTFFFSTSYILVVIKKQKASLIYTISTLILNALALFVGGYLLNNQIITVILISIINILSFIVLYTYTFSKTLFGAKPFLKLVFGIGTLFIIVQVFANILIRML